MAAHRLKLKSGVRTFGDRSRPLKDADGNAIPGRFHAVVIGPGQEFDSDVDLAAKEPNRYERVGGGEANEVARLRRELAAAHAKLAAAQAPGDPTPENLMNNPSVAPGGQVSTGFQQSLPHGSGPLDPADAARAGVKGAQEAKQDAPPQKQQDQEDDGLDRLTVKDLRECCEDEEVAVPSHATKAELIAALRQSRGA